MTNVLYKKPPITEAVIECRFVSTLGKRALDKFKKNYEKKALNISDELTVGFEFKTTKADRPVSLKNQKAEFAGYKIILKNGTNIIRVAPTRIGLSQLAPYKSWSVFEEFARDALNALKKVTHPAFSRIGVRFINRFDIPVEGDHLNAGDYFNIGVVLPNEINREFIKFFTNLQLSPNEQNQKILLNYGSVESQLIDHASFLLDIDIVYDGEIPMRDDLIWKLIGKMRVEKNRVFEAMITDKARELIGK